MASQEHSNYDFGMGRLGLGVLMMLLVGDVVYAIKPNCGAIVAELPQADFYLEPSRDLQEKILFAAARGLQPPRSVAASVAEVRHYGSRPADAVSPELLESGIRLETTQILYETDKIVAAAVYGNQMPGLLDELGMLRQLRFSAEGEGHSHKQRDNDKYDLYYWHIFIFSKDKTLWSQVRSPIQGAYRIGIVRDILKELGPDGLYMNEFFHMHPELVERPDLRNLMDHTLEAGRAFVMEEFKSQTLFSLLKAIGTFIVKNPIHGRSGQTGAEYFENLMGLVSISDTYNPYSAQLMLEFLGRQTFRDLNLGRYLETRSPSRFHAPNYLVSRLLGNAAADLKYVNRLVQQIDGDGVPELFGPYFDHLDAKVLGVAEDSKFRTTDIGILTRLPTPQPTLVKRAFGPANFEILEEVWTRKYGERGPDRRRKLATSP